MRRRHHAQGLDQLGPPASQRVKIYGLDGLARTKPMSLRGRCAMSTAKRKVKVTLATKA